MTNYFKVYLKGNKGYQRVIAKNKAEVIKILNNANKEGYMSYLIIKRIKPNTDVPIARGDFSKECKVVYVDGLDTDWRIVGANVKKYNLFYKTKDKIVEKKNVTKEEIDNFLAGLETQDESELRVIQVKDRDEEEER